MQQKITVRQLAYGRLKSDKASKSELQILLKWAKQEVKEWQAFILEVENKIKPQ